MNLSKKKAILVTGAGGEIGTNLLKELKAKNPQNLDLIGLDINPPTEKHQVDTVNYIVADITDEKVFDELAGKYEIETIFHLAAILSTGGEFKPLRTYQVNTQGSMNVLTTAERISSTSSKATKVIFPSTIAVYGLQPQAGQDAESYKKELGAVSEQNYLQPITMYGVNKLAVEHLGRYFSKHYMLLTEDPSRVRLDFRCIRLPGVLSADTMPTGGTSDYAPEIIHAAAQGKSYHCFANPETTIPFLAMPDAIQSILGIARAERQRLTQLTYNVTGFSVSAKEILSAVLDYFPETKVEFRPNPNRVKVLESWPAVVNDQAARRDWNWSPKYDFITALRDYLIPGISKHYQK